MSYEQEKRDILAGIYGTFDGIREHKGAPTLEDTPITPYILERYEEQYKDGNIHPNSGNPEQIHAVVTDWLEHGIPE